MDDDAPAVSNTPPEERLPFSPGVGCLLSILIGMVCAGAFFFVLWFNQEGQIVYAPEPYRATRVWILRGVEGRGLGVSTTRPLPGSTGDEICARTTVGFYFLAGGMPEANTDYCECYTHNDSGWTFAGACVG
jgi:hypothetical protein